MNSSDCVQSPLKIQGLHPLRMNSSPLSGIGIFGGASGKGFGFGGGLDSDPGPQFCGIM